MRRSQFATALKKILGFPRRHSSHRWHVVGDSHGEAFGLAADLGFLRRPCKVTSAAGATAVGLRNPNALTDSVAIFKNALLPVELDTIPIIHLGEVDCGFVIWYRAKKYSESIETQTAQSIAAYFDFVDSLRSAGYRTIVVTGATPPTIKDNQDWGDVANARREVTTTLEQRTALTLYYNGRLRDEAHRRRLPFVDIWNRVVDPATGLLDDRWRHPDPTNHHLDPCKIAPEWARELNRLSI